MQWIILLHRHFYNKDKPV